MCGIVCAFSKDGKKIVRDALKSMNHRGPDGKGIVKVNQGFIGHNLLSIVSSLPQPLIGRKGVLALNGEIYNWKELSKKESLEAENDVLFLLKYIEKKGFFKAIKEIEGPFALIYYDKEKKLVYLARDFIGRRPLFYSLEGGLIAASERNAIPKKLKIWELNPRHILIYNPTTKKIKDIYRDIYNSLKFKRVKNGKIKGLKEVIEKAIVKRVPERIPERNFGLLFSGGIDSSIVAYYLKKTKRNFTAYTVSYGNSKDELSAIENGKKIGIEVKVIKPTIDEIKKALPIVIKAMHDTNIPKVEVALTIYLAAKEAKKDGVKVLFSGLGADEVFGGYRRSNEKDTDPEYESISNLRKMYEKDLTRDDLMCMLNSIEIRTPFLDEEVITYSFALKKELRRRKKALMIIAKDLGISLKKKIAAQYGSGIDKVLKKIAKNERSKYFYSFLKEKNKKIGCLISGGKDGWYSLFILHKQNYDIDCILTIKSKNKESYMFHTPTIDLVKLQAKASNIPLLKANTKGKKEEELRDLVRLLKKAKRRGVEGISTGAIASNYQRNRIEEAADKVGLFVLNPLWQKNQEEELRELCRYGFKILITKISAYPLKKEMVGKSIDDVKDILIDLGKRGILNPSGEGGEYETFVIDSPLFKKRIIIDYSIATKEEFDAEMVIKKAYLQDKY